MPDRFRVFAIAFMFASLGLPAVAFAQVSSAVEVLPSDRMLYCQSGTTLHLSGACPLSQWTQEARLEIDRHVVARDSGGAMDGPYSFTWSPSTAGQYVVEVTYALASGGRAVARKLTLRVLDEAPIDWEDGPRDEDNDFPITLRRAPLKDFRVAQSYVLIDGQEVSVDPFDFTATVPGGSISDGVHSASIEAFDPSGGRYVSSPSYFGVPPRILFPSPGSLIIRRADQTVPLRAKVSPLWKPAVITYYVNDRPIGSADHAPFLAHADLRDFDSGTYQMQAVAVDEAGHTVVTPPVTAAIINIPRERAAEARAETPTAPTESVPSKATRPVYAPDAPSSLPISEAGGTATVHGLAAGLTSDGTELIGLPVTVQASVRPGTGQTDLSGISDDAARDAAEAATAWIRRQAGLARIGSAWDVTLSVRETHAHASGDPDGVTDALALSCAITGRTIDRSLAAVGSLSEDGALVPVGNIISKADYALSRPGVTTLIVPNSPVTFEELSVLSKMKPAIFQGKRIVYARTMADVLRAVSWGSDAAPEITSPTRVAPRVPVTPHVLTPAARSVSFVPTPASPSNPPAPAASPRAASRSDEDPLNAQLDQWQAIYEKNAGSLKALATQILQSVGGN